MESFRDIFRHRVSLRLHFGHIWFTHFGCANGFSQLCHAFFERGFILWHGIYWWSSSFGIHTCCFGHFIFMCRSSTFLFHSNNISFFFLHVFFGGFWQKNYVSMWVHYGLRVMKVYSKPFNETLCLTTNLLWWYRPSFYGGLCANYFAKELGFSDSIFMLQVLYFW